MGISDLLDTPPGGSPAPRLTPRSPLSIKELTALLIFGALVWGAYDKLNSSASKTSVEKIVETQWQQRLETQHNFDTMGASLNEIKGQLLKADADKKQAADTRRK